MTIETIRKGIINKDLELIIQGFNAICELFNIEPIPPVKSQTKKARGRPKKQPEPEVRILLATPETDEENAEEIQKIRSRKRGPRFTNTWVDNGKLCLEDKLIDKKLIVAKPVERVRKSPMRKIQCSICEKTVEVHGSLITDKDSYTCSNCIPRGK